jgi:hypothetical protein
VTKKIQDSSDIIDPKLMASAKKVIFEPSMRKTFDCKVCGEPGASQESEGLCWVCRRLKISAWREVEMQLPMNE